MTTYRCYRYGLLDPTRGAEVVNEQILLAHRYRNTLTEIERERRAAVRAILAAHPDTEALAATVTTLAAELDAGRVGIRSRRQVARGRAESAGDRAQVRDLAERLRLARSALKAAKSQVASDPTVQDALRAVNDRAAERVREHRAACGVHWGTYLLVEDAADRARKERMDPEFRRWSDVAGWIDATEGAGSVGVQIQGGMTVDEVHSGDNTRLQIDAVPPEAYERGGRRLQRTRLRIRVGSEGRAPIWAEWPMVLHRPLPEGARIKQATVQRRRKDCRRWTWSVVIALEMPEDLARHKSPSGRVAVNLGWRQRGERGLRVAYAVDDAGSERELLLPRETGERIDKASAIGGVRAENRNAMIPRLATWLADRELPEWAMIATARIVTWTSFARLHRLAHHWRVNRWDGDAAGYEILEAWRYRDEHLDRYMSGMRDGALLARREIYRRWAASLAGQYETLVIDTTDYRDMQRTPQPESERVEYAAVKERQRRASPSELRLTLVGAFSRTGRRVAKVPAVGITATCHGCGHVDTWDHAAMLLHTCSACGSTWDQDANAARNLLERERLRSEQPSDADRADGDAVKRRVRSNRKRSQQGAAREGGGMAP